MSKWEIVSEVVLFLGCIAFAALAIHAILTPWGR